MRIRNSGVLVAGAAMAVAWCGLAMRSQPVNPPEDRAALSRAKHEGKVAAIEKMHAGDLDAARAHFQGMVDSPEHPVEQVEGYRLLSLSYRRQGDVDTAESLILSAQSAFALRPELMGEYPTLSATLLLDRAELAGFYRNDKAGAISLYDQIRAEGSGASQRDVRLATQNAAVMSADLGRYGEAATRLDDLFSLPQAKTMPTDEVVSLRLSQVTWFEQAGNLDEAFMRCRLLWEKYPARDECDIVEAGVRLARWYPVPDKCAERLAVLRTVLGKIERIKSSPAAARRAAAHLSDWEQQALIAIVDSPECGDDALVAAARARIVPR